MGNKDPKIQKTLDKVSNIVSNAALESCVLSDGVKSPKRVSLVKLPKLPSKKRSYLDPKKKEGKSSLEKHSLLCLDAKTQSFIPSNLGEGDIVLYAILRKLRQKDFQDYLRGRCSIWHFKELIVAKKKLPKEKRGYVTARSLHATNLQEDEKATPIIDTMPSIEKELKLRLTRCSEFF